MLSSLAVDVARQPCGWAARVHLQAAISVAQVRTANAAGCAVVSCDNDQRRADEGDWHSAEAIDAFTQTDPREGAPRQRARPCRVLAGPKAIVIGIVCDDPRPVGIVSFSVRRDAGAHVRRSRAQSCSARFSTAGPGTCSR